MNHWTVLPNPPLEGYNMTLFLVFKFAEGDNFTKVLSFVSIKFPANCIRSKRIPNMILDSMIVLIKRGSGPNQCVLGLKQ